MPEFATISNTSPPAVMARMVDQSDNEEDDDDDDDDDFEEEDALDIAVDEGHDDEDNDVSMLDPGVAALKRENEAKVEATNAERESLRQEKKLSKVFEKQLLKETKHHSKQMELIAEEQVSRERSQRLKSEKYNREIDKTQRDIRRLHTMFKQLVQQRQKDVGKKAFYEKQVDNLSAELEEAHRQGQAYEVMSLRSSSHTFSLSLYLCE